MSRHKIETEDFTYVVGWDQPLQTFFIQKFKKGDDNGIALFWLGGDPTTRMYEVEDLVRAGNRCGVVIDSRMRITLYGDKDDGR